MTEPRDTRPNVYRDIATAAELALAYSPSRRVADCDGLLAEYGSRSALVRLARPDMQSLAYGPHPDETLDFFPAPDTADGIGRPVAVFIHGGYWQALGKRDHSFPAPAFAAQGMHYIAVNYGLAPAAPLARLIERCREAIAWIHDHAEALGIDRGAIHVSGSSAGAHLAAMAAMAGLGGPTTRGTERRPIRSLTLLSGVYDLRPIPLTYVNEALRLTPDDALLHSPLLRIDAGAPDLPPMLIAVGDNESGEFHRQSAAFAEAIRRRGLQADHVVVAGRNHFDIVFDLADTGTALGAMVARHMATTRARRHLTT